MIGLLRMDGWLCHVDKAHPGFFKFYHYRKSSRLDEIASNELGPMETRVEIMIITWHGPMSPGDPEVLSNRCTHKDI